RLGAAPPRPRRTAPQERLQLLPAALRQSAPGSQARRQTTFRQKTRRSTRPSAHPPATTTAPTPSADGPLRTPSLPTLRTRPGALIDKNSPRPNSYQLAERLQNFFSLGRSRFESVFPLGRWRGWKQLLCLSRGYPGQILLGYLPFQHSFGFVR